MYGAFSAGIHFIFISSHSFVPLAIKCKLLMYKESVVEHFAKGTARNSIFEKVNLLVFLSYPLFFCETWDICRVYPSAVYGRLKWKCWKISENAENLRRNFFFHLIWWSSHFLIRHHAIHSFFGPRVIYVLFEVIHWWIVVKNFAVCACVFFSCLRTLWNIWMEWTKLKILCAFL